MATGEDLSDQPFLEYVCSTMLLAVVCKRCSFGITAADVGRVSLLMRPKPQG